MKVHGKSKFLQKLECNLRKAMRYDFPNSITQLSACPFNTMGDLQEAVRTGEAMIVEGFKRSATVFNIMATRSEQFLLYLGLFGPYLVTGITIGVGLLTHRYWLLAGALFPFAATVLTSPQFPLLFYRLCAHGFSEGMVKLLRRLPLLAAFAVCLFALAGGATALFVFFAAYCVCHVLTIMGRSVYSRTLFRRALALESAFVFLVSRKYILLLDKEQRPFNDATTQNNLGASYTAIPSASPEEEASTVREAVARYKRALDVCKKGVHPLQYAMIQINLGFTYTALPSASPEERASHVRSAIDCFRAALEIYKKDNYPVEYALTQRGLGVVYTSLVQATGDERATNVRAAIACFKRTLEIYKKDEYPQDYCLSAAHLGMILADIDKEQACHWLKEAYSLREYLPDQGKRVEEIMARVCGEE